VDVLACVGQARATNTAVSYTFQHQQLCVNDLPLSRTPIFSSYSVAMAPSRSRPQADDSRSEASSTKEKLPISTASALNGKGRRVGVNAVTGSSLRDVVTASQNGTVAAGSGAANSDANPAGVRSVQVLRKITLIQVACRSNGRISILRSCTDIDMTIV